MSFVRSLEEDLKRRDFTVNAFALNEKGEIVDLFHGLEDLENKVLRAVGLPHERFNEDALRIMRGFRFQASLGFELEEATFDAMKECAPLLEKISVERTFIEFDKLLISPYWRQGLEAMLASGAYHYLPEMKDRKEAIERLFDIELEYTFSTSEQAWAALVLALEIQDIPKFFKKWKTSRDFAKTVEQIVEILKLRENGSLDKRACYKYEKRLLLVAEELREAYALSVDYLAIERVYDSLTIHDKHEVVVNGGMLIKEYGFQPGPALGEILTKIEYAIVDGELANEKEAIIAYIQQAKEEEK